MKLDDMSLDELWNLFPITFVNNDPKFTLQYLKEKDYLTSLLDGHIKRISHIGSTSIKDIKTKPIVDILIEVIDNKEMSIIKNILIKNDYMLMNCNNDKISFNKGYTVNGYADYVFHIHIKKYQDCDELYFRDYLNDHSNVREEYEKLKLDLYNKYNPNRDLYTEGKRDFVLRVVELAKNKYGNRY